MHTKQTPNTEIFLHPHSGFVKPVVPVGGGGSIAAYIAEIEADAPYAFYYGDAQIPVTLALENVAPNMDATRDLSWGVAAPAIVIDPTNPFGACLHFANDGVERHYIGNAATPANADVNCSVELWASRTFLTGTGFDTYFNFSQVGAGLGMRLNGTAGAGGGAVDEFIQGVTSVLTLGPGVDFEDATWHQIVMTKAGTTYNGYVDGQPKGTVVNATAFNAIGNIWRLGTTWNGAARADLFVGRMCMISLYLNQTLSAARVLAHYEAAPAIP